MPKARMTALDLRAMVSSVAPCVRRLRIANVYDISSKVYVLKLSEGDTKQYLVLEAGVRMHLSEWRRDKQAVPSVFTMRLRKFLRTKRIASIQQVGYDRVVDIQIGYGEKAYHLIVEFYARGNVVLTDASYVVTASWRQFKNDEGLAVRIGCTYPIKQYLSAATRLDTFTRNWEALSVGIDEAQRNIQEQGDKKKKEKKSKEGNAELEQVITEIFKSAPLSLVTHIIGEHHLHEASVDTNVVHLVLEECVKAFDSVTREKECNVLSMESQLTISAEESGQKELTQSKREDVPEALRVRGFSHYTTSATGEIQLEDFSPILIRNPKWQVEEFDNFFDCVDKYFSRADVAKNLREQGQRLNELESKIDRIRADQFERVEKLKHERDLAERKATCLELNIDFAKEALEMMSRAVSSGSSWKEIEQMVKTTRREGHPLTSYIQSLELAKNSFVLLLCPDESTENEEGAESMIPVDLQIGDTVYGNVKRLHEQKKTAQLKFERTEAAAMRVIKEAEGVYKKEKESKEKSKDTRVAIVKQRKIFWFEKFFWFISSERYLVIAGHDAIQNDILYRKYLRKNDVYVHADYHGAATCIIRNHTGREIPQQTINETGIMSVCRSQAWKSKVLADAYWVHAYQVSKTPQAGEYVTTGGFIIRGKRNPIKVSQLEMAVGIFFNLGDEDSIQRHMQTEWFGLNETQASREAMNEGNGENIVVRIFNSCSLGDDDEIESDNDDDQNKLMKRRSSQVKFGQAEVLPNISIEPRVDFEELPPEVIAVDVERSVLSDDCLDEGADDRTEASTLEPSHNTMYRRSDSADELPPPSEYYGRADPRSLLRHQTRETAGLETDLSALQNTTEGGRLSEAKSASSACNSSRRADSIDGGPAPRGFLPEEVPAAREILAGHAKRKDTSQESLPGEAQRSGPSKQVDKPMDLDGEVQGRKKGKNGKGGKNAQEESKQRMIPQSKKATPNVHEIRGKKKKLKKMREKYGEQSEDEREEAMKLLGSRKLKHESPHEETEEPSPVEFAKPKPQFEPVADRHLSEEEDDPTQDEEWKARLEVLHCLTGRPMEKDVLTFAIPMCAPYSAIQYCKYKARLTPGGAKKGSGVQLLSRAFIEISTQGSVERALLKQVTGDEISAVLPFNPQIKVQGGDKIMKEQKKAKAALNKAIKKANK